MSSMNLPDAEDMNYFKTSTSSPDTWLSKAQEEIEKAGGEVFLQAKGMQEGRSAYCMEFRLGDNRFRAVWPILPVRVKSNEMAAERQAATMLYHDIKSRAMKARIFGYRTAFFDFLLLPDGRTPANLSNEELSEFTPKMISQ